VGEAEGAGQAEVDEEAWGRAGGKKSERRMSQRSESQAASGLWDPVPMWVDTEGMEGVEEDGAVVGVVNEGGVAELTDMLGVISEFRCGV